MKFYKHAAIGMSTTEVLKNILDDNSLLVSIPTPKNWKCKKKSCKIDYKHKHSIFSALSVKDSRDNEPFIY